VEDGCIDAVGNIYFATPALLVAGLVRLLLGCVSPSLSLDRAFNFAVGFLAKKLVNFFYVEWPRWRRGDAGRLEVVVEPSM